MKPVRDIRIWAALCGLLVLGLAVLIPNTARADALTAMEAYANGDYRTAMKEIRPYAEQGLAHAQFLLGSSYVQGVGVEKDYDEALKWLRLAAEKNSTRALYSLGIMYAEGWGVGRDDDEALRLFRLAGELGHAEAQFSAAGILRSEPYTPEKNKEAVHWYRLAAEQGYAPGQYFSGLIYEDGAILPKDNVLAYMWISLSIEHYLDLFLMDHEKRERWMQRSRNALQRLGKKMARVEIVEAERLAEEWRVEYRIRLNKKGMFDAEAVRFFEEVQALSEAAD